MKPSPFTKKPPARTAGGSFVFAAPIVWVAATWALLGLCCAGAPEEAADTGDDVAQQIAADETVVATYEGGRVTVDEVDRRVLSLPVAERPKPGEPLDAWYSEQIREMVIERRLLEEAKASGLAEESDFRQAALDARKQIRLELCLGKWLPEPEPVTAEDLRAAYDANPDAFAAPERRLVYQVFLRPTPDAASKIQSVRERVLRGEGFLRMAREYSESENRHQDGLIGWMIPGQLPDPFEKVVFGLEEGVPSRAMETERGYYLFYVEQILPERTIPLEEALSKLRERLLAERQESALRSLDARTHPPEGSLVLDRQTLANLVQAGDPSAVVLRMSGVERTLGDLRTRLGLVMQEELSPAASGPGHPTLELAWRVLEQMRRREEFAHRCESESGVSQKDFETRFETWKDTALVSALRQRQLVDLALQDEARLRLFYESNVGSFSRPPTWALERLRVPLGERPLERMARLEQAARDDAPGLESLAEEFGGDVDEMGPLSLAEIRRLQPKLPARIAPLGSGQLAAPYRTQAGLEMIAVVATTAAEPLPFDEVRRRVASAYVQQYTSELYDELLHSVLEPLALEIRPAGLEALEVAARAEPEITVEELEKLFEEM